jgi:deferrochelatase/peroxidase EfeB
VFRRLAQDVPGWWAQLMYQTGDLPPPERLSPDQLAARLVGRWRSGAPYDLAPHRDPLKFAEGDFEYRPDADGYRMTPTCAHIRKMNPRGSSDFDPESADFDRRRILRRGIPFGAVWDPARGGEYAAGAERGLLFNAFMANIEEQFEFLQQRAINPIPAGPDPLIGVPSDGSSCSISRMGVAPLAFALRRHVRTTGAVYAFAPSIPGLWKLSGGRPEGPAPS